MSLLIMVASPDAAGGADAATRDANLAALNLAAHERFAAGHVPVIGVNMALPGIEAAEARGETGAYQAIMMPQSLPQSLPPSLALARRCDAVRRIGGASGDASGGTSGGTSGGADAEVRRFAAAGKPVHCVLDPIPLAEARP
ncbi:MAG: DUF4406 domain-containing protein [Pseudomonadota bacterium]